MRMRGLVLKTSGELEIRMFSHLTDVQAYLAGDLAEGTIIYGPKRVVPILSIIFYREDATADNPFAGHVANDVKGDAVLLAVRHDMGKKQLTGFTEAECKETIGKLRQKNKALV